MLKKVDMEIMKKFVWNLNPALDTQYAENYAKTLIQTLDSRLDDIIYTYCTTEKKRDFSFTQKEETFSVLEIAAMRGCSYGEAVLLMDGYIKDAKTGRARIMRR